MPSRQLTVLIPSRNRAAMARRTIESIRAQGLAGVSILVSDNSTDELERDTLARFCDGLEDVHRIAPPGDLAMTDHWNWAFARLREDFSAPLTTMVTDRMVMRPGSLSGLLALAHANPERVVTFNHDAVDDTADPVRLRLQECSGRAFELSVEHLLSRCANLYFHAAIPRVMNCLIPESMLDAVEHRFGSLFASISPDHCFGFRCLDIAETIVYLDSCPLIHYALARSNGASYARGVRSADGDDFQRHLGDVPMNISSPVPAFHSITNAVVNEYCFVRSESHSTRLPPIDMTRYLGAMARETSRLEDPQLRTRMAELLSEHGWQRVRLRYWPARIRDLLELLPHHPLVCLRLLADRLADRVPGMLASLLGRGKGDTGFADTPEALAHLMITERVTMSVHFHLLPLILPPQAAKELQIPQLLPPGKTR